MRRLRITVDHGCCMGSGTCVLIAPKTFALNEDGQSYVLDPDADNDEKVLEAAEGCPTLAIIVEDVDTAKHLFP